jgi:hypothetical protein
MAERLGTPVGSLADGAERLERLIRGVKDRQFSEVGNAPAPKSVSNAFAVSPEEAWSKKFMTAGIGPNDFKPVQMPAVSLVAPTPAAGPAPKSLEPAIEIGRVPALGRAAAASAQAEPSPDPIRPAQIGQVIAKPARRSWFGRLVRGT